MKRPLCHCGNLAKPNGFKADGTRRYGKKCSPCNKKKHEQGIPRDSSARNRLYKKDTCEECGFVPEHLCQLDLDHIDGNHDNNDPSNHKTLCANCHRLKTHQNKDYFN